MESTTAAPVILDSADGVAVITLNRPTVRNAINLQAAEALAAALDTFEARDDLRAGVLTGAGGFFCAGMDLKAFSATGERPLTASRGAFGIVERPPVTPLIAAIEGPALGGGFEIALACDMIVAAESATFGLPEVGRGLVAAAGGVFRIAQRLPRNLALELVTTGARISAQRAYAIGLVNLVVPDGEALSRARELAARIAAGAPMAVAASKQIVIESADWSDAEAFGRQAPLISPVRESDDAKEGARAFVEKRPPVWTGR
ncbi:Enoyl-CoA-hydratase [Paraconexibacter sp. AEG42_29]|uniref:Enoyl-CoA-hydratase n=1 Tax=Paraconexibacter sp. AEG42_29 TaxID=2997339 RepID=A0AAU7B0E6_9ACTN